MGFGLELEVEFGLGVEFGLEPGVEFGLPLVVVPEVELGLEVLFEPESEEESLRRLSTGGCSSPALLPELCPAV